MDIVDIIPTYEHLLRTAAIASLEVDDFDLDSTNPESAAKFAELQKNANGATMALLNFFYDEGNMLRLLVGTELGKKSETDEQKKLT